jgi:hypothetical protein
MNGWDDLEEWVEEAAETLVKKAKTEAGEIFLKQVTTPYDAGNTPVLSGNLLANTEVGINRAPDGQNSSEDEFGRETYFDGRTKLEFADAWDKIYIVNATEYNIQAEFTGWKTKKFGTTPPYRYWQTSYNNMLEAINK